MYNGFPIGYLLFWANGAAPGARQIGVTKHQSAPRLLIVDGQQRLTSLYGVLKGVPVIDSDYKESLIRIAFRARDATFRVADATTNRDPEYISTISDLWVGELPRNRFVRDFIEKLRASRDVSDDEEDHLVEQIDRLYDLQSYPFTALELSRKVDEEQVAEVFVRINSQAKADRGFWMSVDAEEGTQADWISISTVTGTVRAMSAKHVMVVSDSCPDVGAKELLDHVE